MDKLPDSLLLEILSRLDDSADVARCRVASKAFDAVFPGLRSINLLCSKKWFFNPSVSGPLRYYKRIFQGLISKLETVESVSMGILYTLNPEMDYLYLLHEIFIKECMYRLSHSLKSLSFSCPQKLNFILRLISYYFHNLVNLKLQFGWLYVDNLNPMPDPMPMLTTLTLESIRLQDKYLIEFNKCFPNLQVLKLVGVRGLKDPKIHFLNLQTCHLRVISEYYHQSSLNLITPNLITLTIECPTHSAIHVEAPMLSRFHLRLYAFTHPGAFTVKKFENLKTLWLGSLYISSLLSEFPITKTVENLTLDSIDFGDSKWTLGKAFALFPSMSSLCLKSSAWSEVEASMNQEGWESLDGRKGLKRICAYLKLGDPSFTFSCVACILDQCVDLSEVSLLIHEGDVGSKSKSFMSKCTARWPGLKWRWGIWREQKKDTWISNELYETRLQ